MESFWFWLTATAMALAVAAVLLRAMLRRESAPLPATADLQVYRDQLAEADRDLARGTLSETEAARVKTEISRRILEADRQSRQSALPMAGAKLALPAGLALAACAAALVLYARTGQPAYPDLPIKARIAMADNAMATRPSQAQFLTDLGQTPTPEALAAATASVTAVTDPDALRALSRDKTIAQDFTAAEAAQRQLLHVLGDKATAQDHTSLALILTLQAQGYVSPEAELSLRAALTLDPGDQLALYLLGEMLVQGQRYDLAFRFWRPVLEQGNPDAPWVKTIREKIEDVAYLAGQNYTLPEVPAAGPTSEDVAAAADMTPEDRQAMIEGMVAQLGDRLATSGGTAQEWAQLITALGVLGRKDEAQAIYAEAQTHFAASPADLETLAAAATAAGLAP